MAESYASPETVSDVARRHGLASGQLFAWRRHHRDLADDAVFPATTPLFVPALVEALPAPVAAAVGVPRPVKRVRKRRAAPMVEVVLDGASVKIARGADATVIAAVLDALKTPR